MPVRAEGDAKTLSRACNTVRVASSIVIGFLSSSARCIELDFTRPADVTQYIFWALLTVLSIAHGFWTTVAPNGPQP
jgi:hypothetical protein